jgi:hypothetical protein
MSRSLSFAQQSVLTSVHISVLSTLCAFPSILFLLHATRALSASRPDADAKQLAEIYSIHKIVVPAEPQWRYHHRCVSCRYVVFETSTLC